MFKTTAMYRMPYFTTKCMDIQVYVCCSEVCLAVVVWLIVELYKYTIPLTYMCHAISIYSLCRDFAGIYRLLCAIP